MSITRAQVNGVEALAAWLNDNCTEFFSRVTYANEVLTATDNNDNVVMEICVTQNSGYLRAYRSDSSYIEASMYQNVFSNTINIIKCDNGIIIDATYYRNVSRKFGVLISPTNNEKLAIIFSYGGTTTSNDNYLYTQIQHVALGDSPTMATTTTFTPETAQQTTLCPFGTNADVGTASYTTDAYYMPMGQNYNSGLAQFSIGNDHFITNGYWAIRTGGDE